MKKRFLSLLLLLALTLGLALPVCAASTTLSPGVACMTEDVTLIKSGIYGKPITFSQGDFKKALGVSRFTSITVCTLPDASAGVLTYKGEAVKPGDQISFGAISHLTFHPANEKTEEASFRFTAGNLAGGGEIDCILRYVKRPNYAPTLLALEEEDLAVETQKGVSLWGRLQAADPEGDAMSYRVISYPKNGTLQLSDAKTGEYRYTPKAGFTGKDSFRYVVRDSYGNWSGEAEVRIRVEAAVTEEVYADMTGTKAENAALHLTARSIMQGELIGDGLFFHPEKTLARGEFLVMAMKASGLSPAKVGTETCFDDNAEIPSAMRPYVAAAQQREIVYGSFSDGALCFHPSDAITKAEAAVILCRILDAEEPLSTPTFQDGAEIPVWARPAINALYEMGIYAATASGADANASLTRGEAAEMLYRVLELTEGK